MAFYFLGFLIYTLVIVSEQSLARLNAHDLDSLRAKPGRLASRAVSLVEDLRSSLAALLLARVFMVLAVSVAAIAGLPIIIQQEWFIYATQTSLGLPEWAAILLLLVCLVLIFGFIFWGIQKIEFIRQRSPKIASLIGWLSPFMMFWKFLFSWFIRHEKATEQADQTAVPEVSQGPNVAVSSEKRELELIKSIVQFGDVTVKQVMQPRSKVVAVDFKTTFPDLLNTVCENEFSRMPVIDEDLDNVTGILYVKDLVPHLHKPDDFEWQTLVRPNLMLVPESKRGIELLREFKQEKMHMALVVDEYGGSSGLVTLEDILEEVIGDIRDEFDAESEIRYRKLDDYNFLFEGQILLNDVCRITGLSVNVFDEVRGNSDTLAGLALELRGDIPPTGAEISWEGYILKVISADSRKIEQLKLTLPR
ncbi:MAG: transporter associated domain-containing protein [Saprospiraceae bacterium]|nr:CBS domain-containing protein [Lewinellaceae bacterium]